MLCYGVCACEQPNMSGRLRGQACAPLPALGAAFPEWWPEFWMSGQSRSDSSEEKTHQGFCESHLLPRLSNWTALFLESHNGALGPGPESTLRSLLRHLPSNFPRLTPQELRRVLRQPRDMDAIVAQQLRRPGSCRNVLFETVLASALRLRENGPAVQLFNLAVRWLHSFLPFLLKKVRPRPRCQMVWSTSNSFNATAGAPRFVWPPLDGVASSVQSSFSKTLARCLMRQLASESGPRSRQLLSVPFVGKDGQTLEHYTESLQYSANGLKDQPSEQAEFSHPDAS